MVRPKTQGGSINGDILDYMIWTCVASSARRCLCQALAIILVEQLPLDMLENLVGL